MEKLMPSHDSSYESYKYQLLDNIYGALNTDSVLINRYGIRYRFFNDYFNNIIN